MPRIKSRFSYKTMRSRGDISRSGLQEQLLDFAMQTGKAAAKVRQRGDVLRIEFAERKISRRCDISGPSL